MHVQCQSQMVVNFIFLIVIIISILVLISCRIQSEPFQIQHLQCYRARLVKTIDNNQSMHPDTTCLVYVKSILVGNKDGVLQMFVSTFYVIRRNGILYVKRHWQIIIGVKPIPGMQQGWCFTNVFFFFFYFLCNQRKWDIICKATLANHHWAKTNGFLALLTKKVQLSIVNILGKLQRNQILKDNDKE